MDILKMYECLSSDEKKQLMYLLKKERIQDAELMRVRDWCRKAQVSVRLYQILLKTWGKDCDTKLVSDITKQEFFAIRNAGQKTWEEFTELRGY
jgi:hypothetical protein